MNFDFGTGTNRIYNLVSLGFVGAATITCMLTLLILLFGGGGQEPVVVPTEVVFPTPLPTNTPRNTNTPGIPTFTPTFTPTETGIPSQTFTPTLTVSPTLSPTPTITQTSLPTEIPSETNTPQATLGTPPPSPSPFLFALQADPTFTSNLNASACAWQGIGGQVLDITGNAVTQRLQVNVTGGGLAQALTTNNGTNSLYGPGGYEVQIANSINTQTYFVQLFTEFGTPVSEVVQVTFPGSCDGNLALVTFQQIRQN